MTAMILLLLTVGLPSECFWTSLSFRILLNHSTEDSSYIPNVLKFYFQYKLLWLISEGLGRLAFDK